MKHESCNRGAAMILLLLAQTFGAGSASAHSLHSSLPWLAEPSPDVPVLLALDPAAARAADKPAKPDRPALRQREAILSDPADGRALVDRALADSQQGRPLSAPPAQVYEPQRFHPRAWVAPNTATPSARGR